VGGNALAVAAPVVLPQVVVDAVVEVIVFEVLELAAAGREQFLADADVIVHRAADIEKQQHLDRVVTLRPHLAVEPAGVARGTGDGAFEIEFLGGAFAGKAAQAAQGDLDVARAELDAVVEVAVFALLPDLDRRAVLAPPPTRMPSGCVPP
jgi:hypothetical protein